MIPGASSRPHKRSLFSILTAMGLTTGLQLCLDAGDSSSYSGSGTVWTDRSGGSPSNFNFGAAGAAPTFNGSAGGLSINEYFSFNASQYFNYGGANETWMQNCHKDNATYSYIFLVNLPDFTTTNQGLFGTLGSSASNIGIRSAMATTARVTPQCGNGSGTFALNTSSSAVVGTAGAWQMIGASLDEAVGSNGLIVQSEATTASLTSTYTSPSASNATNTMQIAASGGNVNPLHNGAKLAMVAMWSVALTATQLVNIAANTRGRFGV